MDSSQLIFFNYKMKIIYIIHPTFNIKVSSTWNIKSYLPSIFEYSASFLLQSFPSLIYLTRIEVILIRCLFIIGIFNWRVFKTEFLFVGFQIWTIPTLQSHMLCDWIRNMYRKLNEVLIISNKLYWDRYFKYCSLKYSFITIYMQFIRDRSIWFTYIFRNSFLWFNNVDEPQICFGDKYPNR